MKLKVLVYDVEEGGYWTEVPSIPGCATHGESLVELFGNHCEAAEGCLSVGKPASGPCLVVRLNIESGFGKVIKILWPPDFNNVAAAPLARHTGARGRESSPRRLWA